MMVKNIDKKLIIKNYSIIFYWFIFSLVLTSLIASDKLDTNDYSFFFKHLSFIF